MKETEKEEEEKRDEALISYNTSKFTTRIINGNLRRSNSLIMLANNHMSFY